MAAFHTCLSFFIKCMIVNQTTLYDHILQAGIDSNMLTIALEPEAAAIYVKHLPVDRRLDGEGGDLFNTFAPGSKYIVVDAGGMCARIWLRQGFGTGHFPLF